MYPNTEQLKVIPVEKLCEFYGVNLRPILEAPNPLGYTALEDGDIPCHRLAIAEDMIPLNIIPDESLRQALLEERYTRVVGAEGFVYDGGMKLVELSSLPDDLFREAFDKCDFWVFPELLYKTATWICLSDLQELIKPS